MVSSILYHFRLRMVKGRRRQIENVVSQAPNIFSNSTQEDNCHSVMDKYVEYDVVILLLDVLLLRIQSFRHLIFNYDVTMSLLWKLSVVLILCEAYTKLRRLHLETSDAVILQVNFHTLLVQSTLEFMLLYLLTYFLMCVFSPLSFKDVLRIVVIFSYGKLSAIAAMIWTGDFYLWLPLVLVLPSQFQAFRAALLKVTIAKGVVMVLVLNLTVHGVNLFLMDEPRTSVVQFLLDDYPMRPCKRQV